MTIKDMVLLRIDRRTTPFVFGNVAPLWSLLTVMGVTDTIIITKTIVDTEINLVIYTIIDIYVNCALVLWYDTYMSSLLPNLICEPNCLQGFGQLSPTYVSQEEAVCVCVCAL